MIIEKLNDVSAKIFSQECPFNHVLAQTYHNVKDNLIPHKERKAKIAQHSDKTKDMPENAVMAFCSFYAQGDLKLHPNELDSFDLENGKTSVLTKLRFKLKKNIPNYSKEFDVTLYPNSVFIIPLSTNRLYTHEIVPSTLPINKIPTIYGTIFT